MKFGDYSRQLREKADLKPRELAARVGKSVVMISHIERGRALPSKKLAAKLKVALRLTEDEEELFDGLLKKEAKALKKDPRKEGPNFGPAFSEVINKSKISRKELIEELGISKSALGFFLSKAKLAGDEFVEKLYSTLEKRGIEKKLLDGIIVAHLEDTLARSLRLEYLGDEEQKELIGVLITRAKEKRHLVTAERVAATEVERPKEKKRIRVMKRPLT